MADTIVIEIKKSDLKRIFFESIKDKDVNIHSFDAMYSMAIFLARSEKLHDFENVLKEHEITYSKKTFIKIWDEIFDRIYSL